jgi:hypothetical protein
VGELSDSLTLTKHIPLSAVVTILSLVVILLVHCRGAIRQSDADPTHPPSTVLAGRGAGVGVGGGHTNPLLTPY